MSGRGRGRGRAPTSGGRQFLMRSAEECGFDSRNLRSLQDITRPQLFPDILLHSSGDNKYLRIMEEQQQQQQEEEEEEQQQIQHQQDQEDDEIQIIENKPNVKLENGSGLNGNDTITTNNKIIPLQKQLSGTKRSIQTLYLITKGRDIHHRIQSSAFNVKSTKDVPDIIRYSDSTKQPPSVDASDVLSHCLSGRTRTAMGQFVPEELVSGQKVGSSWGILSGNETLLTHGKATNVSEIEPRPRFGSIDNADGGFGDDDDLEAQGSEDEGEDYVADYYASEGEESNGDDNEATF